MANTKERRKMLILLVIIVLILLVVTIVAVIITKKNNDEKNGTAEFINNKIEEINNNEDLKKLYSMSEQERITFYCAEFFKLIDNKKYEEAYEILYDVYKENYFPTLSSFREYIKTYFPDDFSLDYTNFERLGDYYVLWIDLKDTLNGSRYGHNFSLNVVIRENDFNDYDLSFSRNSAVN